jgi:hypothetical protein
VGRFVVGFGLLVSWRVQPGAWGYSKVQPNVVVVEIHLIHETCRIQRNRSFCPSRLRQPIQSHAILAVHLGPRLAHHTTSPKILCCLSVHQKNRVHRWPQPSLSNLVPCQRHLTSRSHHSVSSTLTPLDVTMHPPHSVNLALSTKVSIPIRPSATPTPNGGV